MNNKLIDVNLRYIFESDNCSVLRYSLIDENRKVLSDSKEIFKTLSNEGLTTNKEARCTLTKLGIDISEKGGWIKHLELEDLKTQDLNEKSELKEKYEKELRRLNIKLAQSNLDSNIENSETRKITNRNSNIGVGIGIITLIALCVQIWVNNKVPKTELQVEELMGILERQDTLESKLDSIIFVNQEVIQDTIHKSDN
jgi:hypothetical protein